MKKTLLAVLALGATISVAAQNTYDAVTFSDNNYYGTAKSMAMGNAMTAVGGDLGSIGFNPAGSAVASYSQFSITPGFATARVTSSYSPEENDDYGSSFKDKRKRFIMPSIGATMYMPTGNRTGFKGTTFGFLLNTNNIYLENVAASGTNPYTSMSGEFASEATGYGREELDSYSSYSSSIPWNPIMAYQSGMISYIDGSADYYKGAAELAYDQDDDTYSIVQGGPVTQSYNRTLVGNKTDMIFNVGFNFSDKFYLGFNFGLPMLSYTMYEYNDEAAVDPSQFKQTINGEEMQYESSSYQSYYSVSGVGVYAKAGMIWRPVGGLRLGAAIQSPTYYDITENYQISGSSEFDKGSGSASSPEDNYGYALTSPWVLNLGVAYTLGQSLLVSADYEMDSYNRMAFSSLDQEYGYYDYTTINNANAIFTGRQHTFRAGAEFKLSPAFALRAGYVVKTSPVKYGYDSFGNYVDASAYINNSIYNEGGLAITDMKYESDRTRSYSFGFGNSTTGSFFWDLAFRWTKYPDTVTYLYDDYSYFDDGNVCTAPSVLQHKTIKDIVLTLGFRF